MDKCKLKKAVKVAHSTKCDVWNPARTSNTEEDSASLDTEKVLSNDTAAGIDVNVHDIPLWYFGNSESG